MQCIALGRCLILSFALPANIIVLNLLLGAGTMYKLACCQRITYHTVSIISPVDRGCMIVRNVKPTSIRCQKPNLVSTSITKRRSVITSIFAKFCHWTAPIFSEPPNKIYKKVQCLNTTMNFLITIQKCTQKLHQLSEMQPSCLITNWKANDPRQAHVPRARNNVAVRCCARLPVILINSFTRATIYHESRRKVDRRIYLGRPRQGTIPRTNKI